ncbi:Hsp70 family protein [Phytohabitans sp. ZYX-F-186]|uniref:Hsp70 family protein n=1 Tax=Phytohabitans maris TaxID=3071409 RepID=A0ABU0ZTK5_9ACTN|nr:Hsp70 family protein [Phytohabitans sp. ZYX-F-186]MDQ7909812.1 Hsp70 family protein [Phytohabitans sp. ZYX-F-186]
MPADRTPTSGHALGIDFGTSHTVAVVRWPDGRGRPLLLDGSPLLPSAVYAEPGGALIVGRDAVHSARLDPARFEPNPKRRIDDGTLLLGDREVPVGDLVSAVLARVAEEWERTVGRVRPEVTLTCPATWGATRRRLLADAAARAGFEGVRLVAEPVAAATYFAKVLGREVPIGSVVVVHDFGAGTFDASVVARKATGFEVLAVDGRDDIGGLDVDAAIIAHLEKTYADRDRTAWARLENPSTAEERRAKRQLWDDVRVAKERLSRSPSADLMLPLLDLEVHLTRVELEQLATPILEQTVRVTQGVMRWAKLPEGQVAGVFLVGGSSRMPLMATLLHRALGEAPEVIEQPELVVAEGSILAGAALLASAPPAPGPATSQMRLGDLSGRPVSPAIPPPTSAPPAVGVPPGSTRVLPPEEIPSNAPPIGSVPSALAPGSAPGGGLARGGQGSSGSTPSGGFAPGSAGTTPGGSGSGTAGVAPPAPADSTGSAGGAVPPAPGSAPGTPPRTVGRVIVPGAQPPSGRPRAQVPPPSATKPMPRFEEPTAPPTAPGGAYPPPAPPTSPAGGYAPPASPPASPAGGYPAPGGYPPASTAGGYAAPGQAHPPPNAPHSPYPPPSELPRYPAAGQPRYSPPPTAPRTQPAPPQVPLAAPRGPQPAAWEARVRRRPGFVVRAIRALVITALLVVVPVAAGVFAFAAARDQAPAEVVGNIVDWIQDQAGA